MSASHGSDQSSVISAPLPAPPEGATSAAVRPCYVCGRTPPLCAVPLPGGLVRCGRCRPGTKTYARNPKLLAGLTAHMRAPVPAPARDKGARRRIVEALS